VRGQLSRLDRRLLARDLADGNRAGTYAPRLTPSRSSLRVREVL